MTIGDNQEHQHETLIWSKTSEKPDKRVNPLKRNLLDFHKMFSREYNEPIQNYPPKIHQTISRDMILATILIKVNFSSLWTTPVTYKMKP